MKLMQSIGSALAVVLMAGLVRSAAGQSAVSSADIQRLQDTIYDVSRDLGDTRTRDRALASQLDAKLDSGAVLRVRMDSELSVR